MRIFVWIISERTDLLNRFGRLLGKGGRAFQARRGATRDLPFPELIFVECDYQCTLPRADGNTGNTEEPIDRCASNFRLALSYPDAASFLVRPVLGRRASESEIS